MILELAERRLGGVFHLAGSTRISRYDFALNVARKFGLDESLIVPVRMDDIRWVAKRPRDSSLDVSKASKLLSEKPYGVGKALDVLRRELNA
jgi:dTDP-4-dehydrorhamnose reductase